MKKEVSIDTLNRLGFYDFGISKFDIEDDSLTILADRGYPYHFRAEIKFVRTEYIVCPTYFSHVLLRKGTAQEIPSIGYPLHCPLYCFEETVPSIGKEIKRFFIIADSIEISVYYEGGHEEILNLINA